MENNHILASVLSWLNSVDQYLHGHLQTAYDCLFDFFGRDHFFLDILGATCITMGIFWLLGGLYALLDLTHWPAALYKYKMHDKVVRQKKHI